MLRTSGAGWDVVVVGGGPAGSAAAIWCARQGLRVALLERVRFPRHRPGETLPPGVEPIFGQLGVVEAVLAAGFIRHLGTWSTWAGPRHFAAFGADQTGAWRGFQAPREILDRILLDEAGRAGGVVRQPCRALRPVCHHGTVVGVETTAGPMTASWVIDAGGGAHWLARRLGLPLRLASPRLVARYGYVRGDGPICDEAPEIVADDTGWTWTARVGPDLYQWTRLSLADDDPRSDGPPPAYAGLTPLPHTRGADVTWRMVARPAGAGYICVGDAAAVLDPASSHGVLKALMSGMMAGHVIARMVSGAVSPRVAVDAYTSWLSQWFEGDIAALAGAYRELPHPPAWISAV